MLQKHLTFSSWFEQNHTTNTTQHQDNVHLAESLLCFRYVILILCLRL
jgi:antirestriction protein